MRLDVRKVLETSRAKVRVRATKFEDEGGSEGRSEGEGERGEVGCVV